MEIRCKGCYKTYDKKYDLCPYCGYYDGAEPKEPFQLTVGTELADRYVLGSVIGFGGFGITYKAWDKTLETVVAVKEYYPGGLVNRIPGTKDVILFSGVKKKEFEFGLERFIVEAQNMAKFSTHENIVNVFTYFEENNTAYIVMEFLEGCTLSEKIKAEGLLSTEDSVEIVLKACNALKDIHATGIIHRDISPDNIFIKTDGIVKLIDFGAARFSQNSESNYTIILKPGFAPPEQYEQISSQGPWTDIYAVGATLYYLLTGHKPEESTNRKIKDTLKEPVQVKTDIPEYLSNGITKAMALEPHMRFKSVDELISVIKAEKKVRSLKKEKLIRRSIRFAGIFVLVTALVVISGVFSRNFSKKKEEISLPPANLTVWYPESYSPEKKAIYETLISEFCSEYEGVNIELISVKDSEYTSEKVFGSDGGNIFLTKMIGDIDSSETLDLTRCVSGDFGNESFIEKIRNGNDSKYLFMDEYDSLFPERNCVPLGFIVPVLYVNTSLTDFNETSIENVDDLLKNSSKGKEIIVSNRLKSVESKIFKNGITSDFVNYGEQKMFISGEVAYYFATSDEFFDIRTMPSKETGIPRAVQIETDILPCQWGQLWSVCDGSEEQNEVAIHFLHFLLSDNAQTRLFCNGNSAHEIPINSSALETFCEIFEELSFVSDIEDMCVFN